MSISRSKVTASVLQLPTTLRSLLAQQSLQRPATSSLLHSTRALSSTSSNASSVDPTEVSHFNALASSWWDPHGPSRLLHLMNPLRHRFINSCLTSQADPPRLMPNLPISSGETGLRYLDVGCGGGIFAESAARMPGVSSVTGVDPSSEVLAIAKEHARRDPNLWETGRLKYLNCGIEDLPSLTAPDTDNEAVIGVVNDAIVKNSANEAKSKGQEEQGYDIVSLWEVLEHVSSPNAFLDILTPHVKPGGWFVMSTIARTWTSWVTTKLFAEDILRIVPRGTHDWAKYINEPEVRKYFETKVGWESPRAMGVLYVPGVGWREARGGEDWGNYLWAIRKSPLK